jgi:hypothetical protein
LTAALDIVLIARIRKFQKETGRWKERASEICGGEEWEREHDLAEIGTASPRGAISVVQGSSFPVCVYCGCSFKRRRNTAIYCSAICREKVNTVRAIQRRKQSATAATQTHAQCPKPR